MGCESHSKRTLGQIVILIRKFVLLLAGLQSKNVRALFFNQECLILSGITTF